MVDEREGGGRWEGGGWSMRGRRVVDGREEGGKWEGGGSGKNEEGWLTDTTFSDLISLILQSKQTQK